MMQSYAQNSSYQNQLNINMLQIFAYFKKISYRRLFSIPTDYKTDNDLVILRRKRFLFKNVAVSQFINSDYVRFHRFPYQPISKDRELPFWSNSLFLDLYSIPSNYKQNHGNFNSHINAMFCDGTDWGTFILTSRIQP